MKFDLDDVTFMEVDLSEVTTTRVVVGFIGTTRYPIPVGALTFDRDGNTIELIYVQDWARRKGIARALVTVAEKIAGETLRPGGDASPMGKAFIASVWGAKRTRKLDQAEADVLGNRLMVAIHFELAGQLIDDAFEQAEAKRLASTDLTES